MTHQYPVSELLFDRNYPGRVEFRAVRKEAEPSFADCIRRCDIPVSINIEVSSPADAECRRNLAKEITTMHREKTAEKEKPAEPAKDKVPHWPALFRMNEGADVEMTCVLYSSPKDAEKSLADVCGFHFQFIRLATELPPIYLEPKK